jgi:hypothetical protein
VSEAARVYMANDAVKKFNLVKGYGCGPGFRDSITAWIYPHGAREEAE